MKKTVAAILAFGLMAGLLLFCVCGRGKQAGNTLSNMREMSGGLDERNRDGIEEASGGEIRDNAQEKESLDGKKIALTFDDGPHPYYTEQLLDGLKERGVAATFFVTGEHAELHPDIIKRMHEDG